MLKCVIVKDDKRIYFDFCGTWEKFQNALYKMDLKDDITHLKVNDPRYNFKITICSKGIYERIKALISSNDKLYDIYYICKKVQYDDIDFKAKFIEEYQNLNSISELRDLYVRYSHQIYNQYMDTVDHEKFKNPYYCSFEPMRLFGVKVLFTEYKIDNHKLPKGLFKYELRETDGSITQIGKTIIINHYGTIISNKKLKLEESGYRDIDEIKNIKYSQEPEMLLRQYIDEYKTKGIHRYSI